MTVPSVARNRECNIPKPSLTVTGLSLAQRDRRTIFAQVVTAVSAYARKAMAVRHCHRTLNETTFDAANLIAEFTDSAVCDNGCRASVAIIRCVLSPIFRLIAFESRLFAIRCDEDLVVPFSVEVVFP